MEAEPTPPVTETPPATRPTRLWISILPAVVYWLIIYLKSTLELPTFIRFMSGLLAGALLTLFTVIWWWVNRRTSFLDKLFGFAVFVVIGVIVAPLCDSSTGVQGLGILMGPLPLVLTIWTLWTILARSASPVVRRVGTVVVLACAWGSLTSVRLEGLTGNLQPEYHWRWTTSSEDAFAAEHETAAKRRGELDSSAVKFRPGDWPGFRGTNRDGIVRGTKIRIDWANRTPAAVWRHRVGPAWSSIVVVDGKLFTQVQRKSEEAVVCYDAATGEEVWSHGDEARFNEETAGPGPRATPCFYDGKIYSLGCTGIVNCLNAATGKRIWQHNISTDTGAEVPHWGFTASPLVVDDLIVVFGGGTSHKDLIAYRAASGDIAWAAPVGETSYGSPQVAEVAGRKQIMMLTNAGVTSVDPKTGAVLWEHSIPLPPSAPRSIVPLAFDKSKVLVASEGDIGTQLLDITEQSHGWSPTVSWSSRTLKPAFNDPVIWEGNVYGFDGRIFTCVDLETGNRRWKAGRYGEGQVALLADQALLVVVSESGEVILLKANPDRHEELAKFQGIEGKTWNHPAIVDGRLYLRNAKEMACYDLRSVNKQ
jgi:outer membrane protein assembly factor BamB